MPAQSVGCARLVLHWLRPVSLLPLLAARLGGLVVLALNWWLVHSAEAAMKRAGTNVRPDQPSLAIVTDLEAKFGEPYRACKSRVRRWI